MDSHQDVGVTSYNEFDRIPKHENRTTFKRSRSCKDQNRKGHKSFAVTVDRGVAIGGYGGAAPPIYVLLLLGFERAISFSFTFGC